MSTPTVKESLTVPPEPPAVGVPPLAAGSASVFVVADWVKDIIEGPQGMNSFQRHEMVIWNEPERIAAANWVLRCLANPRCEGSDKMLHAILERRKNAMRSQNTKIIHARQRAPIHEKQD